MLEPTRAPSRPRGSRTRTEARRLSPILKVLNGLLTLVVIVLAVGGASVFWFTREVDRAGPLTTNKAAVVRRGEGARDIAQRLEADGVITSHHVFVAHYVTRYLATWFGGKPLQFKAGEYEFQPGATMRQVADLLGEGKSVLLRVTVPEGLTSHQIAERLKADSNLAGDIAAVPAEGALLPDTYKISRGMSRQALIDMMLEEQREFLEKAWAARQPGLPIASPAEAVILASIVEKETGRQDERTRVAAVFLNRLKQGMRIQSDPTILYGLFGGQVQWGRPIYRSEIQQKTAHNTYQIDGLPSSAICNPGRAAIEAVLNPAKTADLYFVADGSGGHVFSQTLKDHNSAVATWRKVEKDIRTRQTAAAKSGSQTDANDDAAEAKSSVGPSSAAGQQGGAQSGAAQARPAEDVPLPVRKPKRTP